MDEEPSINILNPLMFPMVKTIVGNTLVDEPMRLYNDEPGSPYDWSAIPRHLCLANHI